MTKFSFALVVMLTFAGSLCAGQEDPIWKRMAPCPGDNGECRGGSIQTPTLSQAGYAAQFPGAGYIPTAAEAFAYYIAQQQAENARIAAENARIKAAILKAQADAHALQAAIASFDTEIANVMTTAAATAQPAGGSRSGSRTGSRPGSRAGCLSPIIPHQR